MKLYKSIICLYLALQINEGLPGVLRNKGTLAKYQREQESMSLFLENRGTKPYKLEDEKKISKFIKRGTNKENVWEHGNIGQFWKGTREQGPSSMKPKFENESGPCLVISPSEKKTSFKTNKIKSLDKRTANKNYRT